MTWNLPSENKKVDTKYYSLFSDSLINYRQELLKSIDLAQGDVQGLKDLFLKTELELKLVEEVRRIYDMELLFAVTTLFSGFWCWELV